MKELVQKVKQWGIDRGLDKVGHLAQAKYTLKETAELLDAYADSNIEEINDAIGDILVTLIVGASNNRSIYKSVKEYLIDQQFKFASANEDDVFNNEYTDLVYQVLDLHSSCKDKSVYEDYYTQSIACIDVILSIINFEFNQSLSLYDCLQLAYNEIKDRTGKKVNGQFIKD